MATRQDIEAASGREARMNEWSLNDSLHVLLLQLE